jgi:hypothetical protein
MIYGGTSKSTIKFFTDDCMVYWKIKNDNNIYMFQIDLDRHGSGQ